MLFLNWSIPGNRSMYLEPREILPSLLHALQTRYRSILVTNEDEWG
jgi:hypothetical protein